MRKVVFLSIITFLLALCVSFCDVGSVKAAVTMCDKDGLSGISTSTRTKKKLCGTPDTAANPTSKGATAYCFQKSKTSPSVGQKASSKDDTIKSGKRLCALYTGLPSGGGGTDKFLTTQIALWMIQEGTTGISISYMPTKNKYLGDAKAIYNKCKNQSSFKVKPTISISSISVPAKASGGSYKATVKISKNSHVSSYKISASGISGLSYSTKAQTGSSVTITIPEAQVTASKKLSVTATATGQEYYINTYNFSGKQRMGVLLKHTIHPTSSKTATVAPTYYTATVKKVDSNSSASLSGATIALYKNANCSGSPLKTLNTNGSGVASFTSLLTGTYSVKETKAPEGYQLNSTCQKIGLNGTVTIKNTKINVAPPTKSVPVAPVEEKKSVSIKKVDSDDENKTISNVAFELYNNDKCSGEKIGEATTEEDGIATFNDLDAGDYYVKEAEAPEGYKLDESCHKATLGGQIVVKNKKTTNILIKKVDSVSSDITLEGAEFDLYDNNNCSGEKIVSAKTDEEGTITFENLKDGEYYVKETKAPDGYVLNTTCTKVESGIANEIKNNKQYNLVVSKVDIDDQDKLLPGATFVLYEGINCTGTPIKTEQTSDEGKVLFSNLEMGNYSVKEVKAPTGYYDLTDINKSCKGVQVNGGSDLTFENTKIVCKIVDGIRYNDEGKVVTEDEYNDACNPKCEKLGDKYYDNTGKEVEESAYNDACNPKCEQKDGKYYDNTGKEVQKADYEIACNPKCEQKDGKYYNIEGKEVDEKTYNLSCNPKCEKKDGVYYDKTGTPISEDKYNAACFDKCGVIGEQYYDINANPVSKEEYYESCNPKCETKNGKYYDRVGKPITETEYNEICNTHICEVFNNKYYNSEGKQVEKSVYEKSCNPKCEIKNNKYYNSEGKEVSEKTYNDDCNLKCKIKDNKYYDDNGKEVKKEDYEKACNLKCDIVNNKYYNKEGKEVSKEEYDKSCSPKCEIAGGKFYNKEGKPVTEDEYNKSCNPKCEAKKGNYFDNNGKPVTAANYKKACNPKCEQKDGKYYDDKGNIVSKTKYDQVCGGEIATPDTASPLKIVATIAGVLLIAAPIGFFYRDQIKGLITNYLNNQ